MGIGVKMIHDTTTHSFRNSSTQSSQFLLLVFQKPQPATNDFTGIVVSAGDDAGADKIFEMFS